MKVKSLCGVLCLLGIISLAIAGPVYGQGVITHTPPGDYLPGEAIELEVLVEGVANPVRNVRILYRRQNGSNYRETAMESEFGYFRGVIPGQYAGNDGVEYLIVANLDDGSVLTYPEESPYENPVILDPESGVVSGESGRGPGSSGMKSVNPAEMIISPRPGSTVSADEVLIAVSLYTLGDVDSSTVRLTLDGVNITGETNVSSSLVSYRSTAVRSGQHGIRLSFKDTTGKGYQPLTWRFTVRDQEQSTQAELNVNGGMYIEASHHDIKNQVESINKFSGDVRGSYGWLDFRGDVYLTSKQDPGLQPRNRYSMQLRTPYMQMDIGDSYPGFSRLGLWNTRVRGVNARLLLDYVNLHFVYGSTRRAIPGVIEATDPQDAFVSEDIRRLTQYTFGRRILAIRPSFGGGEHFQLGFSFISSRDDTSSVSLKPDVSWGNVTPKDNLVLGSDLYLAFDRKNIEWESSAAVSWENNNIFGGPVSSGDTLDFGTDSKIPVADLPIDPSRLSSIFIFNQNVQPLLPVPSSVDTNMNLQVHPWTLGDYRSLAYQTKLKLNYFHNVLTLEYRKIGAAYNSYGNPYLRRDVGGLSISDRIRLLNNRLYLNLGYESLTEGLSRESQDRISFHNYTAGLSVYPGGNYPEIHYTFKNNQRRNGIDDFLVISDTLAGNTVDRDTVDNRVHNRTMSNTFTLSQDLSLMGMSHRANLTVVRSLKNDQLTRAGDYPAIGYSLNLFSVSVRTTYSSRFSTRFSVSLNNNETGTGTTRFQIASLGARYQMLDDKLILSGTGKFTRSRGTPEFTRAGFDSRIRYQFLEHHSLDADFQMGRTNLETDNYTNLIFRLRYSYDF